MTYIHLHKPLNPLHWLRIYKLYRAAFPAAERKPFGIILNMHRRRKADVWYLEKEKTFAGFAATINSDKLVLLDYLAVAKEFRSAGVGSAAMKKFQEIYADRGFFVEIESTAEHAPNQEEREKRKQFYQRAGMEDLQVTAKVFGVKMELLGSRCQMTFEQYRDFYRAHYSPWAAENIQEVPPL